MSSTRNQPTSNWRQRQAEKERLASDAIHRKKVAKTEENFPTTLVATAHRMVVNDGPDLASRLLEAHIKEEVRKQVAAYHKAENDRERRNIVNGLYIFRRGRATEDEEEDEDEEEAPPVSLSEQFPAHGRRGFSTEPDSEGWRLVTKRWRHKKTLTNAQLERLAALPGEDEWDEENDHNGDLTDRNQRRDFY
jgi:hypothetical protein